MKSKKEGFTLILAMGIVLIISLMAYNILDYIIPFSREIKGVENSSKSYYLANDGIENGLYNVNIRNYSGSIDDRTEYGENFVGDISSKYNTFSSGTILPPGLEGNSEYDNNWNIISQGLPIQLSVGNGYLSSLNDFALAFRTPNLDKYNGNIDDEILSGSTLPIISWQISSNNNTLNASGGLIIADNILDSSELFSDSGIDWENLSGVDLNGIEMLISDFYGNSDTTGHCYGTNSGCILKFSIINKLELDHDNIGVPYLEWRIDISTNNSNIPLRYTKVSAAGKSMGYKKELEIKIPGKTLNQAFDFTVFQ